MFSQEEHLNRIQRLQHMLREQNIDLFVIFDSTNLFYYTGTGQNGVLLVPAEGDSRFLVRRSLERAHLESPLDIITGMKSFREVPTTLEAMGVTAKTIGYAGSLVPAGLLALFQKYLPAELVMKDIQLPFMFLRAVKSEKEIEFLKTAGEKQAAIYAKIPSMLQEGMSEWDLAVEIQYQMMKSGDPCFTRMSTFNALMGSGNVSFGKSGNYPTAFDGPGGSIGNNKAIPILGSPERKLQADEPIYIDFLFSEQGYHVDCTRVFSINKPAQAHLDVFQKCIELQDHMVKQLIPGNIPENIFTSAYEKSKELNITEGLMGGGSNQVGFFGHGIGLVVDEMPVIAPKFKQALEAGMVIAIEPKVGIEGFGLVGIENTWLVGEEGAEKITPADDNWKHLS
ncbi:MAG: aminopeptidase P family protein [Planctomycetes bacterium]|nr:aminopeptidase P family protein [Planctomycetota bacterium]